MKRIFAVLICLLGTATVFAQLNKQIIEHKLKPLSSAGAHKNGVTMITLMVEAEFPEYGENEVQPSTIAKKCPAIRIAPNTLLASRACMDLRETGTIFHDYSSGGIGVEENVKVNRWIDSVKIKGHEILSDQFFQSDRLLAVVVDANNKEVNNLVQQMPVTNLFVAKDPQQLKTVFSKMTLNRNDKIFNSRECAPVDIANVCTGTQCFQLCWKMIDGKTGDPVFGRNPKTNNSEYLLGFNVTNSERKERKTGRWYHFLSQSSLDFFKKYLPAEEWDYIKNHVKDEKLYK